MLTKLFIFFFALQIHELHAEAPPEDGDPDIDEAQEATVEVGARGVSAGAVSVSRKRSARSEKKMVHQHISLSADTQPRTSPPTFRWGYAELFYFGEKNYFALQGRVAGALLAMACYGGGLANLTSADCPDGPSPRSGNQPHVEMVVAILDYGADKDNRARGKYVADALATKRNGALLLFDNFTSDQVGTSPKLFVQRPVTFRDGALISTDMSEPASLYYETLSAGMTEALYAEASVQGVDIETTKALDDSKGNSSMNLKFMMDPVNGARRCEMMGYRRSMNNGRKLSVIVADGALGQADRQDYASCEHVEMIEFDGWGDEFESLFTNPAERDKLKAATWLVQKYTSYDHKILKTLTPSNMPNVEVMELGPSRCGEAKRLNGDTGAWNLADDTSLAIICGNLQKAAPAVASNPGFKAGLTKVDQMLQATGSLSKFGGTRWESQDWEDLGGRSAAASTYIAIDKVFDVVAKGKVAPTDLAKTFNEDRKYWNDIRFHDKIKGPLGDFEFKCDPPAMNEQPLSCSCTCKNCIDLHSSGAGTCTEVEAA